METSFSTPLGRDMNYGGLVETSFSTPLGRDMEAWWRRRPRLRWVEIWRPGGDIVLDSITSSSFSSFSSCYNRVTTATVRFVCHAVETQHD